MSMGNDKMIFKDNDKLQWKMKSKKDDKKNK